MATDNEKSKQYENFVLDFVNAKTSDEIFFNLLDNIGEICAFSPQFKEKARHAFPTRKSFTSLPKIEKQLLILFHAKRKFWKRTEGTLNPNGYEERILSSFDYREGGSLTYEHCFFHEDKYGDYTLTTDGDPIKVHSDDLHDLWVKYGMDPKNIAHCSDNFRRLVNVEKTISNYKKHVSESRFHEIEELSKIPSPEISPQTFRSVLRRSKDLRRWQRLVGLILSEIVHGTNLYNIPDVGGLLLVYNKHCRHFLEVLNTGEWSFEAGLPLKEWSFFPEAHTVQIAMIREKKLDLATVGKKDVEQYLMQEAIEWFEPCRIAIAFCTIEFLRTMDRRKLLRCDKCQNFFMATKLDKRIKNCHTCSSKSSMSLESRREYQRNRRKKMKEEKEAGRLEAKIANFLKYSPSSTREDALEYIKADSEV